MRIHCSKITCESEYVIFVFPSHNDVKKYVVPTLIFALIVRTFVRKFRCRLLYTCGNLERAAGWRLERRHWQEWWFDGVFKVIVRDLGLLTIIAILTVHNQATLNGRSLFVRIVEARSTVPEYRAAVTDWIRNLQRSRLNKSGDVQELLG